MFTLCLHSQYALLCDAYGIDGLLMLHMRVHFYCSFTGQTLNEKNQQTNLSLLCYNKRTKITLYLETSSLMLVFLIIIYKQILVYIIKYLNSKSEKSSISFI